MYCILVTGTPDSGKSTVAGYLQEIIKTRKDIYMVLSIVVLTDL